MVMRDVAVLVFKKQLAGSQLPTKKGLKLPEGVKLPESDHEYILAATNVTQGKLRGLPYFFERVDHISNLLPMSDEDLDKILFAVVDGHAEGDGAIQLRHGNAKASPAMLRVGFMAAVAKHPRHFKPEMDPLPVLFGNCNGHVTVEGLNNSSHGDFEQQCFKFYSVASKDRPFIPFAENSTSKGNKDLLEVFNFGLKTVCTLLQDMTTRKEVIEFLDSADLPGLAIAFGH